MRQTFAVLVRKKLRESSPVFALDLARTGADKAFIVEAETAKKAENQVKRSKEGQDFRVLYAVEAEQLPTVVVVKLVTGA
jgi:hypothetical protein